MSRVPSPESRVSRVPLRAMVKRTQKLVVVAPNSVTEPPSWLSAAGIDHSKGVCENEKLGKLEGLGSLPGCSDDGYKGLELGHSISQDEFLS
jgi:hypothetical protein